MVKRKEALKLIKRKVALKVHPDKLPGNSKAEDDFKKIGAVANKLNKLPENYNLTNQQLGQYISDNAVEVIKRRGITDLPDWYVEHLKHRRAAPRPQPAPRPRPRPQPAPQPAPRQRAKPPSPPKSPTINETKGEVQAILDEYYSLPYYKPKNSVFKSKPYGVTGTFRGSAAFLNGFKLDFVDIRDANASLKKKGKILVIGPDNNYREPFVINVKQWAFKRYNGVNEIWAKAVDSNDRFYYVVDRHRKGVFDDKMNVFVDKMKQYIAQLKTEENKKARAKEERNKKKANAKEKAKAEKEKAKANAKEKAKAEKAKAKANAMENTPGPAKVPDVNRLLKKYREDPKYNHMLDPLLEKPGNVKWLKKHYLRPADVNKILRGEIKRKLILEPLAYDRVYMLDLSHKSLLRGPPGIKKRAGFVKPTYFYKSTEGMPGLAVTGYVSEDHYIVVTQEFIMDFEKYLKKEGFSFNKTPPPKTKSPTPPKAKTPSPPKEKTPSPVSVEKMQLLSDVNRLLRKFRSSPKYDLYNDALLERPGNTKWLTKHYLRPAQVNRVLSGKVKRILIIEPQTYDLVQVLDKNHMNFPKHLKDKNPGFVKPTYFYKESEYGLAVTGSGEDHYIVVTQKFKEDFEKYLKKQNISLNKTPSPKAKTPSPPPSKTESPGSVGPPGICKCRCKKGLTEGKTTKTGKSYYFMKDSKKVYCGQKLGIMTPQCKKYC